jgi:hypothetical protein
MSEPEKADQTLLSLCNLLQQKMDSQGPHAAMCSVVKLSALFIRMCAEEGSERDLLSHISRSIEKLLPPPPVEQGWDNLVIDPLPRRDL